MCAAALAAPCWLLQETGAAATPQATPRGGKKGAEASADSSLAVGAFGLQPATAMLAAGSKQIVTVTFKAEGAKQFVQQIGIAISDRSASHALQAQAVVLTMAHAACASLVSLVPVSLR